MAEPDSQSEYRAMIEFYDYEYADQQMLVDDYEMLLGVCCDQPGQKIVEIGCGTGRAAIAIAEEDHRVIGFDVDATMLSRARVKVAAADGIDVELHQADATRDAWSEIVGRDNDIACCFFNTFLAFSRAAGQENCLREAHRCLRPGGKLWIDIFNPDLALITNSIGGVEDLEVSLFALPDGRTVQRTTSLYANVIKQIQHVTFHYKWFEDGELREADSSFDMTWITPRELDRLLRLCGFEIEQRWGDYDGSDLDDDAPRQIVLARKVGE